MLLEIVPQRGAELVVEHAARLDDRVAPAGAGVPGARVLQLQAVLDDPAQLAAHGVALARAQVRHLLDQVGKIEVEVRAQFAEPAQSLRLGPGPGVKILLVQLLDPGRHGTLVPPTVQLNT